MRAGLVLMCLLNILSCVEDKNSIYLQQQEISVIQPIIKATNTIIDSSVTVTANLDLKGVDIYYTDNGEDPTSQSFKYQVPVTINKEGVYKFRAFHKDWKPSDIAMLKLYKKGHVSHKIDWHTKAHSTYPGVGSYAMLNNLKGSLNFRDPQWIGFDSIAKATVYFKNKPFIKSVTIGYLIDTKSWIFPPEDVTLYLNESDTIHVDIKKLTEIDLKTLEDIQIPIAKNVSSISIEVSNTKKLPKWHPGNGMKGWLFMDEWIFN